MNGLDQALTKLKKLLILIKIKGKIRASQLIKAESLVNN